MKRWILTLALAALMLICPAMAEESTEASSYTGTLFNGIVWTYEECDDGSTTLTFSGNGELEAEWDEDSEMREGILETIANQLDGQGVYFPRGVSKMVISDGITGVGQDAMSYGYTSELEIAGSVKRIGNSAFSSLKIYDRLILNEGLEAVGHYAFYDIPGYTRLPQSLTDIARYAFGLGGSFLVYQGSGAQEFCDLYGEDCYYSCIVIDARTDEEIARLQQLCIEIGQLVDVPIRYTMLAQQALGRMQLTVAQMDRLSAYISEEAVLLRDAMRDNDMTAAEILGFVQRFISMVNELGVEIEYALGTINGYPGVTITVKANAQAEGQTVSVYRTGEYDWGAEIAWDEAQSGDESADGAYSYYAYQDGVILSEYLGTETGTLVIPAEIDGYKVYGLGPWFEYDGTGIVISEGVEFLQASALSWCENLVSVTLPDSMVRIDLDALTYCSNLSEIHLGSGLKVLNTNFSDTALTELHLPASLEQVDSAWALQDIQITVDSESPYLAVYDGVLYDIDDGVLLMYPSSKTDSEYLVREGTVRVDSFSGNVNIRKVVLPDGVRRIENEAFDGCTALEEIHLPDSLESIGYAAFAGTALTAIELPDGVSEIGVYAFDGTDITSIHIPAQLNCSYDDLYSVIAYLPLAEIDAAAENENFYSIDGVLFEKGTDRLLKYPRCKADAAYAVPEGTTAIGEGAFEASEFLEALTIPSSVRVLERYALSDCRSLKKLTLNEGLEEIKEGAVAFAAITSISLPSTLHSIGREAFYNCSELVDIEMKEGLVSIDEYAFCSTAAVTIDLPESLRRIDAYALPDTLTSLVIPGGVTYLDEVMMISMNDLESITIPPSVVGYAYWFFAEGASTVVYGYADTLAQGFAEEFGLEFVALDGSLLTAIELPYAAMTMTRGDFAELTVRTEPAGATSELVWKSDHENVVCIESSLGGSVRIRALSAGVASLSVYPEGQEEMAVSCVITVEQAAGEGVAVLPENLEAIGSEAFCNAEFERVIIPEGVSSIGARAFMGCNDLMMIEIPDSVVKIGADAFSGCRYLMIIYCNSDSYAAEYAESNGWDVFYLDTWKYIPRNVDPTMGE